MTALVVAAVAFIVLCWVLMLRKGNLRRGVATLVGGEHVGDPSPSTQIFRCGFEVLAPGAMVASNPLGQCRVDEDEVALLIRSTRYARFERPSTRVTPLKRRLLLGQVDFEDRGARARVTPNDWDQFLNALEELGWRLDQTHS